ncbi:MAG: 4Fe-4S dicluster domain-containing protein [Thermodesulfobacteriota bacterium]|jgi:heterodisulfide reductase subunit C|nr:MAG: 4Fe-4S dicluster domain-containing protein [Thermodesulfobacteriota bacterium]
METKLISLPVTVNRDTRFRDLVVEALGEAIFSCYQCCKCSAGCPVAFVMDLLPHQVIRSVLLLQREKALSSRTIWICASCETCTTRCPNEIDIAKVMDVLRQIQVESGTEAKEPKVPIFHRTFLNTIKKFGRIHELSLLTNFLRQSGGISDTIKSGEWKNDLRLGIKMFLRGKLKLLPPSKKGVEELRKLFDQAKEHKKS